MVDYTVVPHARGYWIQAADKDGSRRLVERYGTEEEAVRRLQEIYERDGVTKQKGHFFVRDRH